MATSVSLYDGTYVLARVYKGRIEAVTYANATQAEKAAAKHDCFVYHRIGSRVWYLTNPNMGA